MDYFEGLLLVRQQQLANAAADEVYALGAACVRVHASAKDISR